MYWTMSVSPYGTSLWKQPGNAETISPGQCGGGHSCPPPLKLSLKFGRLRLGCNCKNTKEACRTKVKSTPGGQGGEVDSTGRGHLSRCKSLHRRSDAAFGAFARNNFHLDTRRFENTCGRSVATAGNRCSSLRARVCNRARLLARASRLPGSAQESLNKGGDHVRSTIPSLSCVPEYLHYSDRCRLCSKTKYQRAIGVTSASQFSQGSAHTSRASRRGPALTFRSTSATA